MRRGLLGLLLLFLELRIILCYLEVLENEDLLFLVGYHYKGLKSEGYVYEYLIETRGNWVIRRKYYISPLLIISN